MFHKLDISQVGIIAEAGRALEQCRTPAVVDEMRPWTRLVRWTIVTAIWLVWLWYCAIGF